MDPLLNTLAGARSLAAAFGSDGGGCVGGIEKECCERDGSCFIHGSPGHCCFLLFIIGWCKRHHVVVGCSILSLCLKGLRPFE